MNVNTHQLDKFCSSWLRKAKQYERPRHGSLFSRLRHPADTDCWDVNSLSQCFDRFTSLYVVFNRVYTEAGKLLLRRGVIALPRGRHDLPDRKSATEHVVTFYGEKKLKDEIVANQKCKAAVDTLAQLIRERRFYLHEDYATGLPDSARDLRITNEASSYKPQAILSLIYQARCNLFHGDKDFEERQRILLDNMSIVLEFIVVKVLAKLKEEL